MGRPYSLDLRERVARAVLSGQTCRSVAARFAVSVSSVVRWSQKARRTGSPAAEPMGGHRPYRLDGERTWLLQRLSAKPDLTLQALVEELAVRGTCVSIPTLWRFLKREGISFKKNRSR